MDYPEELDLMGTVFRKKKGEGAVTLSIPDRDSVTVPCQFYIVQFHDGKIRAYCETKAHEAIPFVISISNPSVEFEGMTVNGYSFKFTSSSVTKRTLHNHNHNGLSFICLVRNVLYRKLTGEISDFFRLEFPLTNFDIPLTCRNTYTDPAGEKHEGEVMKVTFEDTSFHLLQDSKRNKKSSHTKEPLANSRGFTFIKDKSEIDKIKDLFSDLCIILSLVQGTRINHLGYKLLTPQGQILEECWFGGVTGYYKNEPLACYLSKDGKWGYLSGKSWEVAVETILCKFQEIGEDHNLYACIASFISAVTDKKDFIDSRGLRVCAVSEIIRFHYKKRKYKDKNWKFCKTLKKLSQEISYRTRTTNAKGEDFSEIERDTNTNNALKTFVSIRNSLVHEGKYCLPDMAEESQKTRMRAEQYEFVKFFTAGLLTFLLGWKKTGKRKFYMPDAVSIPKKDMMNSCK